MSKTVVAAFANREQAEKAVNQLRSEGFEKEISVVAKQDNAGQNQGMQMGNMTGGDSVSDGATTGGALGALAGLAVGAGALAIPGLGALVAAGPIAGMLSGAATGGLAGGLVDFGIPEAESKQLEEDVRQGKALVAVKTDRAEEAAQALRNNAGENVKIHG
ncbi:SPOR domain-containing protein [Peptococcaceae bacterium 1198_IL3148]